MNQRFVLHTAELIHGQQVHCAGMLRATSARDVTAGRLSRRHRLPQYRQCADDALGSVRQTLNDSGAVYGNSSRAAPE